MCIQWFPVKWVINFEAAAAGISQIPESHFEKVCSSNRNCHSNDDLRNSYLSDQLVTVFNKKLCILLCGGK